MVMTLASDHAAAAIEILAENGVEAFEIGSIVERQAGQPQTVIV